MTSKDSQESDFPTDPPAGALGIWSTLGSFTGSAVAFQRRRHSDPCLTWAPMHKDTTYGISKTSSAPGEAFHPQESCCQHQWKLSKEAAIGLLGQVEPQRRLLELCMADKSKFKCSWIIIWDLDEREFLSPLVFILKVLIWCYSLCTRGKTWNSPHIPDLSVAYWNCHLLYLAVDDVLGSLIVTVFSYNSQGLRLILGISISKKIACFPDIAKMDTFNENA